MRCLKTPATLPATDAGRRASNMVLSVEDAFATGVGFDLLGGYLLARGLLADPRDMAHRASTLVGYNGGIVEREVRARIDGVTGIAMLGLGFLLQFGGYVTLIAGAKLTTTGAEAALLAVGVALALVAVAILALVPVRSRLADKLRLEVEAALKELGATD
jgi:hypothetical protein